MRSHKGRTKKDNDIIDINEVQEEDANEEDVCEMEEQLRRMQEQMKAMQQKLEMKKKKENVSQVKLQKMF